MPQLVRHQGVLSGNLCSAVVIMVAIINIIIPPVWLKIAYKKDQLEPKVTPVTENDRIR